jgi:signal peptidase I
MRDKARNPYLSALLSLLAPGLGHVYAGQVVQGLALAGGTAAIGMLGTVAVLATPFWARLVLSVAGAGLIALWTAATIGAIRCARDAASPQNATEYDRGYVCALLIVLTISSVSIWALAVREKVAQVFRVPSASMDPTIRSGARVLVDKLTYRTGPVRRGDIVVFVNPNERYQDYIKRVVAVPGDTVEMRDDDVFVNGAILSHDGAVHDEEGGDLIQETNAGASYRIRLTPSEDERAARTFAATKVPNGHCFLLGDNRHHSVDSRAIGPVPLTDIVGRVDPTW